MIFTTLYKQRSIVLTAILMFCLSGCKDDFVLHDTNGKIVGNGALEVTALFPSPVHLSLEGKDYTGQWDMEKIYEAGIAKSRRRMSERSYMAYIEGHDPAQLKHGEADLVSGDGSKMQCDFYYRGRPSEGTCNIDGKQLTLTVL